MVEALDSANLIAEFREAKKSLGACFKLGFNMLRRLSDMSNFLLVPTVFVEHEVIMDLGSPIEEFTYRDDEEAEGKRDIDLDTSLLKSFGRPIRIDLLCLCLGTEGIRKDNAAVAAIDKDYRPCLAGDFLVLLDFEGIRECADHLYDFVRERPDLHEQLGPLGSKELNIRAGAYATIPREMATKILLQKVFLHEQGHACSLSRKSFKKGEEPRHGTDSLVYESIANYLAYTVMERFVDAQNLSPAWKRFLQVFILLQPEAYRYCHAWIQAYQHGRQKGLSELIARVRETPSHLDWNLLREQILQWKLG
jgi:hypothetical protein